MSEPEPVSWSPSQLAAQRVAKRRSTYYATLNLWPFVAVMLALLMPYLSITPHMRGLYKPVDLAVARHATPQPGALREDGVYVVVRRDGGIFLGNKFVAKADLPSEVETALRQASLKKVFVNADARARYGDVKAVIEGLHRDGVTQICFLVN